MSFARLFDPGPIEMGGVGGATSPLSFSVSLNTKGSWNQVIASTIRDYSGIMFSFQPSSVGKNFLLDIGIGAAGSEQIVVPNYLFKSGVACPSFIYIPIDIPAGSRIAIRGQSGPGSASVSYTFHGFSKGFSQADGFQSAVNFGANTTDSGGTEVDAGGVSDTKGAWTQLVAATTREINAAILSCVPSNPVSTASVSWFVDLAIGAAGSEQIILDNIYVRKDTNAASAYSSGGILLPLKIPSGERLSARAQASTSNAGLREIDVSLIGFG